MRLKPEWAIDSEGMRNNCFSKIQLVGQKYQDKTTYASKKRFSCHCFGFQSGRFTLLLTYNTRHKSWNTWVIFPTPMLIWVCSYFSAPKYARLNIGGGERHIWVRTKVWSVNVRNLEKIQDKWLLFQRFVTSIVVVGQPIRMQHW